MKVTFQTSTVIEYLSLKTEYLLTRSILKKDKRRSDALGLFVIGTSHLLIGGGRGFFFKEGEVLNLTPPHTHTQNK